MKAEGSMLVLTLVVACGCDRGPSIGKLVGTFAIEENGDFHDFVRVEKKGGEYRVSEKRNGDWSPPAELTPIDKAKFEALTKEPMSVAFVGLGNNNAAIFMVPPGWRSGKFECRTGFWLYTWLGPIELHKQSSG